MEPFLQIDMLALFAVVAALAGFVDTLAGGGGLITIPMLLIAQVPPVQALAVNKLQGSFGTLTAAVTMLRKRQVRWVEAAPAFRWSLLGGALGTATVQAIDARALDVLVPVVLFCIALYVLLAPKAGEVEAEPRLSASAYRRFVVPVIGFYDGFLGPGAGSFFALTGVALRGQSLVRATATAKVLNFASNLASLVAFVVGGKVLWLVGGVMILGQMAGAYAGSLAVIGGGARLIKPLIVTVCFAMILRYLWQKGFLTF